MALNVFRTWHGQLGVSSGGWGAAVATVGTITVNIPVGATIVSAYLYASTFGLVTWNAYKAPEVAEVTFNGNSLSFTSLGIIPDAVALEAFRADVTSIVAGVVDGGPGGDYVFDVTEPKDIALSAYWAYFTNVIDGEALVIVYELASLPVATVVLIDGFGLTASQNVSFNFPSSIDPTVTGFFCELRMGIGFSANTESTTVTCNGMTVTNQAGNYDDGIRDGKTWGGGGFLITMGGDNDPLQDPSVSRSYADTHERFNLVPAIVPGVTSILVNTHNSTQDDLVFCELFRLYGTAYVDESPITGFAFQPLQMEGTGTAGATSDFTFQPLQMSGEASSATYRPRIRLRTFPHMDAEHLRVFIAKFWLEFQRGLALDGAGPGSLPVFRLRLSRDGGKTFGPAMFKNAGAFEDFSTRVYWNRFGYARDWVFELTVSDPIAWAVLNAMFDGYVGNS